jgi:hypothetical protein
MYVDISRRLRDAVRRKRNEKWRTKCWSILHDNDPAHRSDLVKDILAKNSVATLERPHIFLTWLQQQKSALNGPQII